jgi:hypothetical protein
MLWQILCAWLESRVLLSGRRSGDDGPSVSANLFVARQNGTAPVCSSSATSTVPRPTAVQLRANGGQITAAPLSSASRLDGLGRGLVDCRDDQWQRCTKEFASSVDPILSEMSVDLGFY